MSAGEWYRGEVKLDPQSGRYEFIPENEKELGEQLKGARQRSTPPLGNGNGRPYAYTLLPILMHLAIWLMICVIGIMELSIRQRLDWLEADQPWQSQQIRINTSRLDRLEVQMQQAERYNGGG